VKRSAQGKISRRGFLVLVGSGAAVATLPVARDRWGSTRRFRHVQGPADDSVFDREVINTLVQFLAAFFGVSLDAVDRTDLEQRMAFAVRLDRAWRDEYRTLAGFTDQTAAEFGARTFVQADKVVRDRVIHAIALTRRAKLRERIRALVGSEGRDFLRMQQSTIPHLLRLYRRSVVPWRRRGYQTWPGVAGDMLAYTREPVGASW